MLTLLRGGPAMWLAVEDAERIGVADNDWVEVYNATAPSPAARSCAQRVPRGRRAHLPLARTAT